MTKKQQKDPRKGQPTDREMRAAVLIAEYAELNPQSDFVAELAFQAQYRGLLDGSDGAAIRDMLYQMVVTASGDYTLEKAQEIAEAYENERFFASPDDPAVVPAVNLPDFKYEAFVTNPDLSKLFQYIPQADIEWRQGASTNDKKKVQMLPYVDARAVMRILNETFGLLGWRPEYTPLHGGGFICRLWVFYGGEWHYKEDGAQETQIEAVKGGISGALKRAAAAWGIAQYLYYTDPVWIAVPEGQKVSKQQIAGLRVKINGKQVGK